MKPTVLSFKKGVSIFKEDEIGEHMFIVQSGQVRIFKRANGKNVDLEILGKNQFFGEMAIITNEGRSASAVAVENCKLLVIDQALVLQALDATPPWLQSIVSGLVRRLQRMNARIGKDLMYVPTARRRQRTKA